MTEHNNFRFIHNPKTGGDTIGTLLGIRKNHSYPKNREDLDNIYSFVFVRNPITRLISWYHHLRKHLYFEEINSNDLNDKSACYNTLKRKIMMEPAKHRELAVKNDINVWIQIMLTAPSEYKSPAWGPLSLQYDYVFDDDGNQLVTEIYRFENYKEELIKLLKRLNKTDLINKIDITNASKKNTNKLRNNTINMIYNYFEKDFATFNYSVDYLTD